MTQSIVQKVLKWIFGAVSAVSLILILLYAAVCIPTFSLWFYEIEYEKNSTYERVDMEKEHLLEVTRHMLRYMRGAEPELNTETVVSGQKRLFFSETEVLHMEDVKELFAGGKVIFVSASALLVLSLAGLATIKKLGEKGVLKSLGKCCAIAPVITVFVFGAIAVGCVINFDAAFTLFHEIFFSNDLWILDPAVDLLINIVPVQFFMDIATVILVIFAAGLLAVCAAGIALCRISAEQDSQKR